MANYAYCIVLPFSLVLTPSYANLSVPLGRYCKHVSHLLTFRAVPNGWWGGAHHLRKAKGTRFWLVSTSPSLSLSTNICIDIPMWKLFGSFMFAFLVTQTQIIKSFFTNPIAWPCCVHWSPDERPSCLLLGKDYTTNQLVIKNESPFELVYKLEMLWWHWWRYSFNLSPRH